jgi:hypothetical protein
VRQCNTAPCYTSTSLPTFTSTSTAAAASIADTAASASNTVTPSTAVAIAPFGFSALSSPRLKVGRREDSVEDDAGENESSGNVHDCPPLFSRVLKKHRTNYVLLL